MNIALPETMPFRSDVLVATEGEFAGWTTWSRDSFESNNGPFWHKVEADGRVRCAFRVEKKHLNGMRNVHGGCFMTFADYCLFAFASPVLQGPGVTVSFACCINAAMAGAPSRIAARRCDLSTTFARSGISSGLRSPRSARISSV